MNRLVLFTIGLWLLGLFLVYSIQMEPVELLFHMFLYFLCILYQPLVDIRNKEPVEETVANYDSTSALYGQYCGYGLYAVLYLAPIEVIYWSLLWLTR